MLPTVVHGAPFTGVGAAGRSGGDIGCGGVDTKVAQWCSMVNSVLKDPNTCGGKAVAQLKTKQVPKMEEFCPSANAKTDPIEAYVSITLALISVESSGNPKTRGDGGKSKGLMQITPGDNFPDCPKSMNPDDPLQNIKCGTCEAFEPVLKHNVMADGRGASSKGIAKQYGPGRAGHPANKKLKDTAKKACGSSSPPAAPQQQDPAEGVATS